jgi:hypothetical protein
MGERGPVPKRDDQRRRRNVPEGGPAEKGEHVECTPPPAKTTWHPTARLWYESLASSGQSWWYQASDWATAYVLAEEISRCLHPQVVGFTKDGDVVKGHRPMGASLAAILKGMTNLMVTEGDRRRARIELERRNRGTVGTVSWLEDARRQAQ